MWGLLRTRQLLRPLAGAIGLATSLRTLHQAPPACAPTEEEHYQALMGAASLDPTTHYTDLSTMGLGTICKVMAYGGGDLQKVPPSATSLKEII